jgi:hypothetical protein
MLIALAIGAGSRVFAGAHTWDVNEIFSNADGTIQFVELREAGGGTGEVNVAGHLVTSNAHSVTITSNVASPTSFRTILFGTAAYAALPGAPAPNYIIPANFLSVSGDTLAYNPYDTISFGAGALPTDGIHSLVRSGATLVVAVNSPQNYGGLPGSIDASPRPATVPDGSPGTPMTVAKLDPSGSSLLVTWDTTSCAGIPSAYHIIYGERSQFPLGLGGTYGVSGSGCGITASPFNWISVPNSGDGSGLIWWLVLNESGTKEGGWGRNSANDERNNATPSGQCGMATKDLINTCGN